MLMKLFNINPSNKPLSRKAFEEIFRLYYQPLCRFCFGIVKDMDTAEEIVQDLFFRLWQDQQNTRISTSLKSYLYKAAYNNSLKHLRQQAVREKYAASQPVQPQSTSEGILERMQEKQLMEVVEHILETLPERTRTIFKMSRFEGLKYHEIASILSISVKTVEANMGKALAVFRNQFKQHKHHLQN